MKQLLCTHCRAPITCNTEDIRNCDCKQIDLNPDTVSFLAKTYHKCLCNDCLKKFDELVMLSGQNVFPKRRSEMIEGLHYYMEDGYFVFTELYHLMKGQCCQNGCRHCVYGFKNRYL